MQPEFKVDVANKDMKRPLHEAAQFARSDVVKYLIAKGDYPNFRLCFIVL